MFTHLSLEQFIQHQFIHLTFLLIYFPFISCCIWPFLCLFTYPLFIFIYKSLSRYSFTNLSIYLSIVNPSTHLPIHTFIPSTHPPIHPFTHLYVSPSIHPSIHPLIPSSVQFFSASYLSSSTFSLILFLSLSLILLFFSSVTKTWFISLWPKNKAEFSGPGGKYRRRD